MPQIILKPFQPPSGGHGSGFTITLSESKAAGQFIRIGITLAAQERYLGGALNPDSHTIIATLNDDAGKNHLLKLQVGGRDAEAGLPIAGGIKGSIAIKVAPWRQVPKGKLPAKAMQVAIEARAGEVTVKLPEWARPEPRKFGQGKSIMEA